MGEMISTGFSKESEVIAWEILYETNLMLALA